jgi:dTDP-4-dehydrorhamnose reductase
MIWLIGNRGMLGSELSNALAAAGLESVGTDRDVDILESEALAAFASGKKIEWIVNCAAYTAVEKAEAEEPLAERLNAQGPENIASCAKAIGAKVLHISTDYVFDGTLTRPYLESDPMAPNSAYGRTKAEGEKRLAAACPEHVIVRTAWLYGKHGPNFVYTMLKLMKTKDRIGVVFDQKGTPTYTADLAAAIVAILRAPKPVYGTFHFTNLGETNWHEFALEIRKLGKEYGLLTGDCAVDALTTEQYPTKAKRPAYSVLSKERIERSYGLEIPDWKSSLRDFFKDAFVFSEDIKILSGLAAYDLDTAQAMLSAGRYLYVVYTCEQAVEKNLKALLCLYGRPAHHHNLARLAAESGISISEEELSFLNSLSNYYLKTRYQVDVRILTEETQRPQAEVFLKGSTTLCEKLRRHPIFSIF